MISSQAQSAWHLDARLMEVFFCQTQPVIRVALSCPSTTDRLAHSTFGNNLAKSNSKQTISSTEGCTVVTPEMSSSQQMARNEVN